METVIFWLGPQNKRNAHQQLSTRAKTVPNPTPGLNPSVAKDTEQLPHPGQDKTGLLSQSSAKSAEKSPFAESNLKQCFLLFVFQRTYSPPQFSIENNAK